MISLASASAAIKRNALIVGIGFIILLVIAAGASWYALGERGPSPMDFAQRQKVSAQSSLHFSFPEYMNHESVQQELSALIDVQGSWSWENDVLIFKPSAPLKTGTSYTFTLPRTALTADNQPLGRDLEFVFVVSGPPAVVARIPGTGSVNIEPRSTITILFDRAMIPLAAVQGEVTKETVSPWPVTIDPPIEGRWRWISTVAREFIPAKALTLATKYTVNVPKGITAVAGDQTEQEFSWSFETRRPEVVSTTPEFGNKLAGPSTMLSITFNQPVNLESAAKLISLLKQAGPQDDLSAAVTSAPQGTRMPFKEVKYGTKEEESGKKVTDKTTIVVVPQQPLTFQSSYALYAAPGILGLEGSLGTVAGTTVRFSTVGELKIENAKYAQENNELQLDVSNPLNQDSLDKGIVIKPAPKNAKEMTWSVYEWSGGKQARAYPEFEPSTAYTVTISRGVKDMFGQSLREPYTFTFNTPPLDPEIYLHSKGSFGIFEKGKPPIYYLNGVNVSKLNVEFAKMAIPEFVSIWRTNRYNSTLSQPLTAMEGYKAVDVQTTAKPNTWESIPFDVEKNLGKLEPGLYALTLTAPEAFQRYNPGVKQQQVQFFAITNLSVTLKYSGDRALVWVTDMQTGNPVKGARIEFHSQAGSMPVSGVTDAQGFFESPMNIKDFATPGDDWEPEFWVTARTDDDFAFVSSQWRDGVQPYQFGLSTDFHSPNAGTYRIDSYLYTERPIYKAGDTVSFKGLLRLRDWDGKFSIPADRKVRVKIQDAEGNQVFEKEYPISAYGSFNGSFPVDPKASLGSYYLEAQMTPETDIGYNYATTNFSVLAYRKPEYKVEVTPESEDYFSGDTVKMTIDGSYYFGAPMAGAKVVWRAQSTDYYFNKYTDGWYSFGLQDYWCWYDCGRETKQLAQGEGVLDATGKLQVSVPVTLEEKSLSQVISIEADITDANNQVVSNRGSAIVHKADAYVGIKSQEYVVTPGTAAKFDVISLKTDGSVLANQSVKVQLFSRVWNSIRKKGVDGQYYYDSESKDTFVRETTVTTNEQGKGTASLLIGAGGEYSVVAIVQDGSGRQTKSSTSTYAWSSSYVNWPQTNSDRMEVIADKPEYKVGETATLLMKSPYQGKGVKALVTIEREGIISKQVIDITSNAQSIEIPITENMIPNAYVGVVVIKPRMGETFNENGLDTGAPAFKIGYVKLSVDTFSKRLSVDVSTDKPQYGPGEKVTVNFKTTDAFGKPVPAELSLGVVDMSLLALSSFETPDLTKLFYSERGLGVYTSQMLSFLLERFKPGSKGGGGADPESRKRGNFKDTAHWQPAIVTDANGLATLSFSLPDNLTTWQLLAIGSTKQHQFGVDTKTILETKNVIVRPVHPRFEVNGDKVTLSAIVHNFLPETKTFTVKLEGTGFSAVAAQTVVVKSGEQATVKFPVTVGSALAMKMTYTAQTDGAIDQVEASIPVFRFGTPQSVATTGVTEAVALEKVLAPSVKDASEGLLSIAVSPSMAAYLPSALDYLADYPYGCTEQTISSVLPALALTRLQGFEQLQYIDRKTLDTKVTTGLEKLYNFQRSDGGFGYWQESDRSYPYLSAYVLYGLVTAKRANVSVDDAVMGRTAQYLQDVLRVQNLSEPLDLSSRAYLLYVLAEYGKGDISLLNNLYDQRLKLPLFGRAQLALAFSTMESKQKASDIMKELQNSAKVNSRGTHFEEREDAYYGYVMNTNQRTTAIVLQAMLRTDPKNPLIPNVVRHLLSVRKDGHWDTTQSTVQVLLAFADYIQSTDELDAAYAAAVEVGGKKKLDWTVGKADVLMRKEVQMHLNELLRGKENEVKIGKNGQGKLYYDLQMSYFYTGDTIPPAEEGMSISRTLKTLAGKDVKTPKVGENYLMTVKITVPEDRNFVAVEAPLPAGMELIDVNLETSQQNLLSGLSDSPDQWSWEAWRNGNWRFSHKEYRDDRLFLFADLLPAGSYEYRSIVRATTPGMFLHRPARAYEMYFPEVFGQTDGGWMTVVE